MNDYDSDFNTGIGLFSMVDKNSVIKNLEVILDCNTTIKAGHYASVGVIVGVSDGLIENCMISGDVNFSLSGFAGNLGGICGDSWGTIKKCVSKANLSLNANVTQNFRFGGLCGVNSLMNTKDIPEELVVENSYNIGTISLYNSDESAGGYIGGLIGYVQGHLYNSYNVGVLRLNGSSKDLRFNECGIRTAYGTISNCYSLENLIHGSDVVAEVVDGNEIVSSSKLQGSNGVKLLNDGQEDGPWTYDKDINNGFPILKW